MNLPNIFYWIAVSHLLANGIGPIRIERWLQHFGDLPSLFNASLLELLSMGLTPKQADSIKQIDWNAIEQDFEWCEKTNCHLITREHPDYPWLLKDTHGAPILLYVRGDASLLPQPQLAIVGSRNPTTIGRENAEQFAGDLVRAGLVITSGLACGIDAASHHGALNAKGKTIAVCGTGLKHVYPKSNRKLAESILASGALISEFPPNAQANPYHFPMRNRIISGMSLGVLVVEAALRSGSLITASSAVDQGREVFALPGSIRNPLVRGCHQLIKQGAKLIETAEDILIELGALKAALPCASPIPIRVELDAKHQGILDQIGYETTALDAIIARSGLTAGEVSSMLLLLELEGYVQIAIGGYVRNA